MGTALEVTAQQISRLDDRQLMTILLALVEADLVDGGFSRGLAQIPLIVDIKDEGEDGLVRWEGGPEKIGRLVNRRMLFQAKAGECGPTQWSKDVLDKAGKLKGRIDENLRAGGTYVLFSGQVCANSAKQKRISAVRKSFAVAGKRLADDAKIEVFSADVIASWANEHYGVVLRVHEFTGTHVPNNVLSWSEWSQTPSLTSTSFQADVVIKEQLVSLRAALAEPGKVVRLVGPSGLGKTRRALEAFRPEPLATEGPSLGGSVVYVDQPSPDVIVPLASALRQQGRSGILVVDNCSLELHRRLVDVVERPDSKLSLLTIDFDLERDSSPRGLIEIDKASPEIIDGMIRAAFPAIREADRQLLTRYADGFPRIAAMLIASGISEDLGLQPLSEPVLRRRLLWGRDEPDIHREHAIRACALFHHIGFLKPVVNERQYVASVCGQSDDVFHGNVRYFIGRRVMDELGPYVRVTPLPLAIRLAEEWYDNVTPERHDALIRDVAMPRGLAEAFAQQFSSLDRVQQAAEIVRRWAMPGGPLSTPEALESDRGSRLLRSFVDVEPDACLDLLTSVIGPLDSSRLQTMKHGRRDIVWSLERLAFAAPRFARAAGLLLALAVAENETWANNATRTFLHLFQMYLAGTEAAPDVRLAFVDEILAMRDAARTPFAIRALGEGIKERHFSRTQGPEVQGSRRYADWIPHSKQDELDYANGALKRLVALVRDDHYRALALAEIANAIRTQVYVANIDGIGSTLNEIKPYVTSLWSDGLNAISDAIRYEGKNLDDGGCATLRKWYSWFAPRPLEDRLELFVINAAPGWALPDAQETNSDEFGRLVHDVRCDESIWSRVVTLLSVGTQQRSFDFGEAVSRLSDPSRWLALAIDVAETVSSNSFNPSFLGGVVSVAAPAGSERHHEVLDRLAGIEAAAPHLAYFTAVSKLADGDLDRLTDLLAARKILPSTFRIFTYGRTLESANPSEVARAFERVAAAGPEGGWATIGVLGQYRNSDRLWRACQSLLVATVATPIVALRSDVASMDRYSFSQICDRLLNDNPTEAVVRALARLPVELCTISDLDFNAYEMLRPVAFRLLKEHAECAWPVFRDAMTAGDLLTRYHWSILLTESAPLQPDKSGFALVSRDVLLAWARALPAAAPHIILERYPLFFVGENGEVEPDSLVEALLSEFGSDENLISVVSANLHSFRFVGSAEEPLRQRIAFVDKLLKSRTSAVASWAASERRVLTERAEAERLRQEAWEHGIVAPFS